MTGTSEVTEREKETAGFVMDQLELIRMNQGIEELSADLNTIRDENPRIFDIIAICVRRLIVDGVRKGFAGAGGREGIEGLRNDLVQYGILTTTGRNNLDEALDECYDGAYLMGQNTKTVDHDIEADWRVEFYKAIHEAKTLRAIYSR